MGEYRVQTMGWVAIDGTAVTRSQRPLVAALALARRTGATIDVLIDAVWPNSVPSSARQSIQNQIARLRHTFGSDVIVTVGDHYRLTATTDVEVVDRLASLCNRPVLTTSDAQAIADVLSTWTGEPYADLPDHPLAQAEQARLHHTQTRLIESLALHRLTDARGDHDAAIVDLTVRTSTEPLHERAWELLVVALHLSGRRTEALGTYGRFCEVLDGLVNAAPSRRFQELRALVEADEPVDLVAAFAAVRGVPPTPLRATA